jgi:hypothetical protein
MRAAKVTIGAVDHTQDAVLVEFSNGQTGSYDLDFLLDHINADGNWDVTNVRPQEESSEDGEGGR